MRLSRPPPLRSLRVFCVAARHRSFKLAAEELFLTPSAVSHQIKELENTLGRRLFVRKTRAVDLTTAAHELLDEVAPLLDALDRSLAQIARRNSRRRLRVQIPPFLASELFVPRLTSFCAAYPDIDIQLDTREPQPSIHPPTADVSILLAESAPAGLKATRLFPVKLVAACGRAHAATVAKLGHHAFRQLALIVHKQRPSAWMDWAAETGLDTPEPRNVIELDSMYAIVSAAEAGLGVALVPEALCSEAFHTGSLVRVFSVNLTVSEAYFVVCRTKDADKPEVAALRDWIVEEFQAFDERTPSESGKRADELHASPQHVARAGAFAQLRRTPSSQVADLES